MMQVIIVPVSEIDRFSGMQVIARSETIAALLGESLKARSRSAFGSDEEFFSAVSSCRADLNTFETIESACEFAEEKIKFLNAKAQTIVEEASRVAATPARKSAQSAQLNTEVVTSKIA